MRMQEIYGIFKSSPTTYGPILPVAPAIETIISLHRLCLAVPKFLWSYYPLLYVNPPVPILFFLLFSGFLHQNSKKLPGAA